MFNPYKSPDTAELSEKSVTFPKFTFFLYIGAWFAAFIAATIYANSNGLTGNLITVVSYSLFWLCSPLLASLVISTITFAFVKHSFKQIFYGLSNIFLVLMGTGFVLGAGRTIWFIYFA